MFRRRQKISAEVCAQETGRYTCACCNNPLFDASKKFEVGSGFPSFWAHIGDHVIYRALSTYNRERTQLLCSKCGEHLGHLFEDARTPTQVRYCINQTAIRFAE